MSNNFQIQLFFIECIDLSIHVCDQIKNIDTYEARSKLKDGKELTPYFRQTKQKLVQFQKTQENSYEDLLKYIVDLTNCILPRLKDQKPNQNLIEENWIRLQKNQKNFNSEDLTLLVKHFLKENKPKLEYCLKNMLDSITKENVFLFLDFLIENKTVLQGNNHPRITQLYKDIKKKARTVVTDYYDLWIEKEFFIFFTEETLRFCIKSIKKEVDMILVIHRIEEWINTQIITKFYNNQNEIGGLGNKEKDWHIKKMKKPFQILISKKMKYIRNEDLDKILELGWFNYWEAFQKAKNIIQSLPEEEKKK
ncbi:hypothetical protein M0813_22711 [Anaeramoeba flamelloides]|uniref:Uncharacterized protein n=1 Tax=Anaeramoeba flamelloides TaxID=1746091 RepID=A0ABQ8YDA7_9EUKA|nr:hypothetical protein M0813_22711 [Anaeramoeba flamelloides]